MSLIRSSDIRKLRGGNGLAVGSTHGNLHLGAQHQWEDWPPTQWTDKSFYSIYPCQNQIKTYHTESGAPGVLQLLRRGSLESKMHSRRHPHQSFKATCRLHSHLNKRSFRFSHLSSCSNEQPRAPDSCQREAAANVGAKPGVHRPHAF